MDKTAFVEVLEKYDLSSENVYEDLSEIGTVLWHDDSLAIKVVCAIEGHPRLSLVTLRPDGDYNYFESELQRFSSSELEGVVTYVKENSSSLRQSSISTDKAISISVAGQEWGFAKV